MLSFFVKPRPQTKSQRYEARVQSRITRSGYKALLQNKVTRRDPHRLLFPSGTHPRIAADEIFTCRS